MRSVLLLALVIFAVALGDIPEKCMRPPPQSPDVECCEGLPKVITPEIFAGCEKFRPAKEKNLPPCEAFVCILKNIGVIGADNKLDKTKVRNYLNEKYSGEWAVTGVEAAEKCFIEMESLKSPCEARTFALCFVKNSADKCPEKRWKDTKECNDSKKFVVECAKELM
ncbi:general odorant-binding protein 66-like [Arctopsyche grandis]|uniref:general odorant-binding protein 66-like n=1 Tax=Arctopsyche grandis TaxID=121162 RepID=UPI00406D800B